MLLVPKRIYYYGCVEAYAFSSPVRLRQNYQFFGTEYSELTIQGRSQ